MKKESDELREWRLRRQKIAAQLTRRLAGYGRRRVVSRTPSSAKRATSIYVVPKVLVSERPEQREQILSIVDSALGALRRDGVTRVRFDFTKTERLYPGGTLMLFAYLELFLEICPGRVQARCAPNSMPAQLLRHCGLADRLGVAESISRPTHKSVIHWKYLTGSLADGEKILNLIEDYRRLGSSEIPEGLYEVLTEALTNVRQHAYKGERDLPDAMKRWWLFANYEPPVQTKPGNLYIAVYDIGIGIQASMRRKLQAGEALQGLADDLAQFWGMPARTMERVLLQRAVEHRRTSTGLPERGRGLPEMRDFVLATDSGRLYIVSGGAQYSCTPDSASGGAIACKERIAGTLILWSLPLRPMPEALGAKDVRE